MLLRFAEEYKHEKAHIAAKVKAAGLDASTFTRGARWYNFKHLVAHSLYCVWHGLRDTTKDTDVFRTYEAVCR